MAMKCVPEIAHRIHRIMKLCAAKIFPRLGHRGNKVRMLRARQCHHGEAMRKWRKVLLQFVRRPACGNEMNLVKIESPVSGPRHRQMPGVNRVDRASKKRDAATMMFCGRALG